MARQGLSFEAVATAAQKISERGERVTLRSVRAELGEGSLTTIQRHLTDWQGSKERKQAAKVDAGLELPANIVKAIMHEIETARAAVEEELRGQLDDALADREALAGEIERLKEEHLEAQIRANQEIGKNEVLQAQLAAMTKFKNDAEQEARNEKSRAEACTARLESAARELENAKANTKEAKAEAKQAHEEAAELRETAAELRGQIAALKTQKTTPASTKKPA